MNLRTDIGHTLQDSAADGRVRPSTGLFRPFHFGVAKAIDQVIVDHADGLHKSIANGGADKIESPFLEVLAHSVRFGGACGDVFQRFPGVLNWLAADELPDVFVERSELSLHIKKGFCILDCGVNLQAVANDARIGQKLGLFGFVVLGDTFWIEVIEGFAVIIAFIEDRRPA